MNKCPNCNGIPLKRVWLVGGWEWEQCYLCHGSGNLSDKELEDYNRRISIITSSHSHIRQSESREEHGDILYGPGEKWGPI